MILENRYALFTIILVVHNFTIHSLGHGLTVHVLLSVLGDQQISEFWQTLCLTWVPLPHVREQCSQWDQGPNPAPVE